MQLKTIFTVAIMRKPVILMPDKLNVTQEMLKKALLCCATDEPAEKYPCEGCYLYPLSKDGHMSTGRTCFEHLAHDVIDYIRKLNDFEHSQCAKLLIVNAQLKAVITDMNPDFFARKCRICGCTWDHACEGGCYWVEDDLCSKCADQKG
jgi:hypothetical protein